jgi:anti-sigma factor RsiW
MPHVDDGQLHAYLDGELETAYPGRADEVESHLVACAVCRARLSDAQGTKLRATSLLREATLEHVEAPDFAVLAGRTPSRPTVTPRHPAHHRRTLHRRAVTLGWAASLIVALCAGWFAREARLRLDGPDTFAAREMQAVPNVRVATTESASADAAPTESPQLARSSRTAPPPPDLPAGQEPGSLSIEQFYSLYSALPSQDRLDADPREAAEPLRRWAESNPQLAQAAPAAHILRWFWTEYERRRGAESG